MMRILAKIGVPLTFAIVLCACEREQRIFRNPPPAEQTLNTIQVSGLNPGANPIATPVPPNTYEESAYAVAEGQKLFDQYNCSGCHFHGGGGIGPPLMDNNWIYGSEPGNIFATIMQGRPNGMPSFRGRIPDDQIWQIAAYVRSLAGLTSKDAAPSRNDDLNPHPAENRLPATVPKSGGAPATPQIPQ